MTKATISDSVKILEQKELIYKEHEPHDTRSYIIRLTQKGKEIADKTSLFSNDIKTPIERLEPSEKDNLLLSLLDVINHLNKSGVITIQRMCKSCAHYQPSEDGQNDFCKLLNSQLHVNDLRIDCPEHKLIA